MWIVVEKPQNNSQTINNKMSVDPNLLKDTKIFQLSPTPRDCYWWKTNLNWIMVCPNDFLEYLNKFK